MSELIFTPNKYLQFDLEKNTIHHYYEITTEKASAWYSTADENSFKRDIIANVRYFRASPRNVERDDRCIQGLENFVSASMTRDVAMTKATLVNVVLEEQRRQHLNGVSNAIGIAQISSSVSSRSSSKARLLGMMHASSA